jgi:hypothetical protein
MRWKTIARPSLKDDLRPKVGQSSIPCGASARHQGQWRLGDRSGNAEARLRQRPETGSNKADILMRNGVVNAKDRSRHCGRVVSDALKNGCGGLESWVPDSMSDKNAAARQMRGIC